MPYQLSTALCPKYTDPLQVCVFRSVLTRGKAKAKPEGEVQYTWGKVKAKVNVHLINIPQQEAYVMRGGNEGLQFLTQFASC